MSKDINLKTNQKEIRICRDDQYVGSIYFSPSDVSIIKRLREVQKKLNDTKFDTKGKSDIDEAFAEADRADREIRDAIDYAFGYSCSDIIFGAGYSFTSANGVSLLEQFLSSAVEYISEESSKEAEASQKRQDKYLAKYAK